MGRGTAAGRMARIILSPPLVIQDVSDLWYISHPFYGYIRNRPGHDLSAMPPRQRREDTVVIGLLGGSVAQGVHPFLQREMNRWFAANNGPRRPVLLDLTAPGLKQPRQTMMVANALLLGGEFDLIVNLDGVNEIAGNGIYNPHKGDFPFFSHQWSNWVGWFCNICWVVVDFINFINPLNKVNKVCLCSICGKNYPANVTEPVGLTDGELLQTGRIAVLLREQARLAAAGETSPLRRSALFGLANRWL